jgi:hypothetical protein
MNSRAVAIDFIGNNLSRGSLGGHGACLKSMRCRSDSYPRHMERKKDLPVNDDVKGEKDLKEKGFSEIDPGFLLQKVILPMGVHKSIAEQVRINSEMQWGVRIFASKNKKLLVVVPEKDKWFKNFEDLQVGYYDLDKPLELPPILEEL